ncbi:MAG: ubiquitin [Metallosphaera sp.]|uniref:ubiquitin n=1 Tax=Metallosphaera sp. TaxID=2020860 RepID=UPI003169243E
MVKVILRGPLSNTFGQSIFLVNDDNLISVLKNFDKFGLIIDQGKVKPGYIVLVNGKDSRLLDTVTLGDSDVVEIIPINHGG